MGGSGLPVGTSPPPNTRQAASAAGDPADRDGSALRFEGIAYSGGVVPAYGWHGDVVFDATDAGRQIAALLKAGFPLQMSVGMNANFREVTEPLVVGGREVRASDTSNTTHSHYRSLQCVGRGF